MKRKREEDNNNDDDDDELLQQSHMSSLKCSENICTSLVCKPQQTWAVLQSKSHQLEVMQWGKEVCIRIKEGGGSKGQVRYKKSFLLFTLNLFKTRLKKKQKVEHSQQNLNLTKLKNIGDKKTPSTQQDN